MTQNLNSAYRVKAFFDKAKQRHVGKNSLEIWAKLFNIEQTDQIKRQFAILFRDVQLPKRMVYPLLLVDEPRTSQRI